MESTPISRGMSLVDRLRPALAAVRRNRDRASFLLGRLQRVSTYIWHLLVWSRISAGRSGLIPIELPGEVLARKGIASPPPRLAVGGSDAGSDDDAAFADGFAEVYALLFANLQPADLLSPCRHAIPGPAFRGVYLWDSAFIAQVWKWWDPEVAREVLLSPIELRDGPRLQHVVSDLFQSRWTQPPLIAWSAVELARSLPQAQARAFLAEIYGPLKDYQTWLETHRRLDNGLYFWAHPYESGVENAPRFSNTDESVFRNTRAIAAPDLSTYVVLQLEALSEMARHLARPAEAHAFACAADGLRLRMNRLLWSERDGLYFDLDGAGIHIRVSTIASLLPLWAGVPNPGQARRMIARILDPAHYGTAIPLPSVARGARGFEKDMWRGPVWVNTAYGVLQGLCRFGAEREAATLALRLCRGVYRVFLTERRIYEFYDPDAFHTRDLRRKRGNWWKALTLGRGPQRDFVGWSGLVNTLVLELLLGLKIGPDGIAVCPRLPPECIGMTFAAEIPRVRAKLSIDVAAADRFEGTWERDGKTLAFGAGFGERIELGQT